MTRKKFKHSPQYVYLRVLFLLDVLDGDSRHPFDLHRHDAPFADVPHLASVGRHVQVAHTRYW